MPLNGEGKLWGTLGDSLTSVGKYQPLVQRALGFREVLNYGRSGCSMTAGGDRDFGATVHIGKTIDPGLDYVTIFAGTNDFRLDKPLGTPDSYDIYTFYGAFRSLVEHILTNNTACHLNLWTPLQRNKDGFNTVSVNAAGCRLLDYVEAIRDIGLQYALPVLDLYRESGFTKLTLPLLTDDGLHPNEAGYARIAQLACSFLSRI